MKRRVWALTVLALVAPAMGVALARAEETKPAGAAETPPRGDEARSRRGEAFRMVDAYVVSHLQESLGLGDEEFATVVPLVTRLQNERREQVLARTRALRELRGLLRSGGAREAQVEERLAELKKLESDGPARLKARMDALDAALSPLQQAKYRLLEQEVESRMRAISRRLRREAPRRRADPDPD